MPYIIGKNCIGVKDTACVDVCPVDCIHPRTDEDDFESADQLFIDPDVCIDCGVCEPECPVEAIFAEDAVPDDEQDYVQINADWYTLDRDVFKKKWSK